MNPHEFLARNVTSPPGGQRILRRFVFPKRPDTGEEGRPRVVGSRKTTVRTTKHSEKPAPYVRTNPAAHPSALLIARTTRRTRVTFADAHCPISTRFFFFFFSFPFYSFPTATVTNARDRKIVFSPGAESATLLRTYVFSCKKEEVIYKLYAATLPHCRPIQHRTQSVADDRPRCII